MINNKTISTEIYGNVFLRTSLVMSQHKHIEAEEKLPPFRRQYFQMHFIE